MSHPYISLRRAIRASVTQFRHNTDTSPLLFHPEEGFVNAYPVEAVETILDEYSQTLPTEFVSVDPPGVMESNITSEAQVMLQHEDMEVRDFARQVMAHMVIHGGFRLKAVG